HAFWRNICSSIKGYFDFKLLGKPRHISLSPYRMLSRLVINNILSQNSIYPFIPAMMFSITKDIVNVPITHAPRKYGKSNYSLKKMISLFGNLMINNSSYLLHLIGRVGVLVFCVTCGLGVALLIRKTIWGVNTTGWTSLFLAISLLGGLNLLAASIIGEYLIRIVRTIEKKPPFCIRHQIEHN
nr:hypothetical protein [Bacteroidales bacterium]